MFVFDNTTRQLQYINLKKASSNCSEAEMDLLVKFQIELPDGLDDKNSTHKKWSVCENSEGTRIFIMLATQNFAWIYVVNKA